MVHRHIDGPERQETIYNEALGLYTEMDDQAGIAKILGALGGVALYRGDQKRASKLLEDALALARAHGDRSRIFWILKDLAMVAIGQNKYEQALVLLKKGLAAAREMEHVLMITWLLSLMGPTVVMLGDEGKGRELLEEGLALSRDMMAPWLSVRCLEGLAFAAGVGGSAEKASRLYGTVEVLRETVDYYAITWFPTQFDKGIGAVRAELGQAAFAAALAEGRSMTLDQAIDYALSDTE